MPPSVGGHEGSGRRGSPYFRFRDGKISSTVSPTCSDRRPAPLRRCRSLVLSLVGPAIGIRCFAPAVRSTTRASARDFRDQACRSTGRAVGAAQLLLQAVSRSCSS